MQKILIIDDEVDICTLLKLTLEKRGFIVNCVHTLTEGIHHVSVFDPAIIIVDINLPDGNGMEMFNLLKDKFSEKAVIVTSAFDNDKEKKEAASKGAKFFLAKPFRLEEAEKMILQLTG